MERGCRKYVLVLISFGVLGAGYVVAGILPAAGANYTTFAGGVVGLYAAYCSGNVAAKWSPTAKEDETAGD